MISFKKLLEMQEQLDGTITEARKSDPDFRERTIKDIRISAIAEVIELNEEMKDTHKTWKQKEFDIEKAKIEAVDVLFFLLQSVNKFKELLSEANYRNLERAMGIIFNEFLSEEEPDYLSLISYILTDFIPFAFETLISFFKKLGMDKQEVIDTYCRKWEINMQRISGDWRLKK